MENSFECRQKVIDTKPDIILLDIMMPKRNGFETLDILRTGPESKKIPIVMFINLSGSHYEEDALRRGAVKFVVKSQVDNRQLIRLINDNIHAYKPY